MIPIPIDAPAQPWLAWVLILPLAAALAAPLLGARAPRLAIAAATVVLLLALAVAVQVTAHGVVEHAVGGWSPPLGIRLRVDGLSAALLATTATVAVAVTVYARWTSRDAVESETRAGFAFWPLLFFMWAGLNAVFVGADLFNLYVALELLTLTAVAMVALDGKSDAFAAAMRYLLFALAGSLAYLLGAVLLYAAYGTLDMQLLREAAVPGRETLFAGALMTAGLMAKTAIFPLHAWLPPAHAGAPAPASAMLSALVVKASFYLILRLWFDVLPDVSTVALAQLLGLFGGLGILLGSLLALRQRRLKMIVAYSTVAQLGYLFLMFPLAGGAGDEQPWSATAWTGGVFHALAHALAKAAMFLVAGLMAQAAGHDRLEGLAGIAHHLPVGTFAFGLAAVSLMGLPPSGGFTAKYLLLTSAIASGQWWWAAVMIAGGLLAAAYLFRALNRLVLAPEERPDFAAVSRRGQFLALALALLSILLGILSAGPYDLLQIGRGAAAVEGLR